MAERDPAQQLDQAIDAILRGAPPPVLEEEASALAEIAAQLRGFPRADFRTSLRSRLIFETPKEDRMTAAAHWIPAGFHTLTPYLLPANAAALIDFLKQTFDAVELGRYPAPDGRIMHAAVRIGDSTLEMGEPPEPRATALRAYVHSVEETYRRALSAGAESLYEPVDQNYGDREAGVKDPAGNYWFLARPIRGDSYKHPGLQDVALYLFPRKAAALLEFLQAAFGAEVLGRHADPEGRVLHADIRIGDSIVGLGEAHDRWQPMPGAMHFYVPEIDRAYERAVAAGAAVERPPVDQPYGERSATVIDPEGNRWYLASRL